MPRGAEATHHFTRPDGVLFHYVTVGDPARPPVVFLHGMPESWYAWHNQLSDLSDEYFCVALDTKGFGQSDHSPDSEYDYSHQATELTALFDAMRLDRFDLVAHDRGAVIADHLCAKSGMASRICHYVRMQQSGNRPHSEPRPPHGFFRSPEGAAYFQTDAIITPAYREQLVAREIPEADLTRLGEEFTMPGAAASISRSFVSAGFERELKDRMSGLFAAMTMPVLFLQGALDPGQQPHEYASVTDEVARGFLEFVDAGHFCHLEAPDAVSDAIRRFLDSTDLTDEIALSSTGTTQDDPKS